MTDPSALLLASCYEALLAGIIGCTLVKLEPPSTSINCINKTAVSASDQQVQQGVIHLFDANSHASCNMFQIARWLCLPQQRTETDQSSILPILTRNPPASCFEELKSLEFLSFTILNTEIIDKYYSVDLCFVIAIPYISAGQNSELPATNHEASTFPISHPRNPRMVFHSLATGLRFRSCSSFHPGYGGD